MTTPKNRPALSIRVLGVPEHMTTGGLSTTLDVPVTGGFVKLESGGVPYGIATVEIPLVDPAVIEYLDPRNDLRVTVFAGDEGDTPRVFDFGLRSREVDHVSKLIRLELATDEALLQDFAPLVLDSGARAHEASLRAVCNYVLAQVPSIRRNLAPFPTAGTGSGWVVSGWGTGGAGTVNLNGSTGVNPSVPYDNMRALTLTVTTAPSTVGLKVDTARFAVPSGAPLTFSGYMASTITGSTWRGVIQWYNAANVFISSSLGTTSTTAVVGSRYRVTATPPAGATQALFSWQMMTGTAIVGSYAWFTGVLVEQAATAGPWMEKVLQPGTADADLTARWNARNLMPNPRLAGSFSTIEAIGCTVVSDTTYPGTQLGIGHNGTHLYTGTATDSYVAVGGGNGALRLSMRPGKTYVYSAWGRVGQVFSGAATDRARRLVVHTDSLSRGGYQISNSAAIPNVLGASARVSVEFTVPEDATVAFVRAYLGDTGSGGGRITWALHQLVERGPGTVADDTEYFWGTRPAASGYTYAFDGLADATASTRTALVERSPDLFSWQPGMTAWEFLEPLTSMAGLRLYADENRKFYLIDPAEFSAPGRVTLAPYNSTEGIDTISRDDPEVWCTGVVVKYSDGKTDAAGIAGRVLVWEYDRPYPGPGAAAAILARRQGQGRTQEVTALAKWDTQPGQEAAISLPGTVEQIGQIASIEWGAASGLMVVGTRGLTDAVPGSYLAGDDTKYMEVPTGITYATFDWSLV